jgi:hypothetical protein
MRTSEYDRGCCACWDRMCAISAGEGLEAWLTFSTIALQCSTANAPSSPSSSMPPELKGMSQTVMQTSLRIHTLTAGTREPWQWGRAITCCRASSGRRLQAAPTTKLIGFLLAPGGSRRVRCAVCFVL